MADKIVINFNSLAEQMYTEQVDKLTMSLRKVSDKFANTPLQKPAEYVINVIVEQSPKWSELNEKQRRTWYKRGADAVRLVLGNESKKAP
jgi:hypothetical protein